MSLIGLFIPNLIIPSSQFCAVLTDSVFQKLENLQRDYVKYFYNFKNKIYKYIKHITGKTEKTLIKLSNRENKIKNILGKVSSKTSAKLCDSIAVAFSTYLQKWQEFKATSEGYKQSLLSIEISLAPILNIPRSKKASSILYYPHVNRVKKLSNGY